MIIYRQQYFGFFTLLEHMELTLSLEGKARRLRVEQDCAACCMNPCPTQPSPITPSRRFPATAGLTSELQVRFGVLGTPDVPRVKSALRDPRRTPRFERP